MAVLPFRNSIEDLERRIPGIGALQKTLRKEGVHLTYSQHTSSGTPGECIREIPGFTKGGPVTFYRDGQQIVRTTATSLQQSLDYIATELKPERIVIRDVQAVPAFDLYIHL